MSLFSAFLLGLIQGVSEFLPISSSGHLAIAQNLFHISPKGADDAFFSILLHLGTLVAVFAAYWSDIKEMVVEFFLGIRDIAKGQTPTPVPPARRLILMIVVGTLPLFAVLPLQDWLESLSANTYFVGGALLFTGLLLFFCDRLRKGKKTAKNATMLSALIVGIGQAIATAPGISRSGTTISVGCMQGYERKFAVRFAFLLSIPAVLGANILSIADVIQEGGIDASLLPSYAVGVITAAVSGYCSIFLVRLVADKGKFGCFAYYCWVAGLVTIVLTALL